MSARLASETTWDVMVVGAGPAGSLAARQLALLGHRVLLVEKKPFPRTKVCGGCLNARAISALSLAGLSHVPSHTGAARLNQVEIRTRGSYAHLALPESLAVSRTALDEALVQDAIVAGVTFLPKTAAQVGDIDQQSHARSVTLQGTFGERLVWAKVVIAADGLQHSSLSSLKSFDTSVAAQSHVGLGATFADDSYRLPPNAVRMCVARRGYVGIVRVEQGLLNMAAAVSPSLLRQSGSPLQAVAAICAETKTPLPKCAHAAIWHGTPPLTRTTLRIANERLFLIGDATGYVEPFTGEGMSWALESALHVAPLVNICLRATASPDTLAARWQGEHGLRMKQRQAACRWMAWTLRSPMRVRLGLTVARLFPAVAKHIVGRMNRPLDGPAPPRESPATPCPS